MIDQRPLWGAETEKAVANFPISGEPIPIRVVHWLGHIKSAAASANAELGLLDGDLASAIVRAADAVAAGDHDDQFPVDVFQTGSGTSSNTNVNEVISTITDGRAHANDHVNLGQSSNDVFPSAVHLAALDAATADLLPALDDLAESLAERAGAFADVVKAGRTHLMDAVPITLGQEFAGYASQVRTAGEAVRSTLPTLGRIPLGGTAVGNGLNTHLDFAASARERLAVLMAPEVGAMIQPPDDHFAAQASRDALVGTSGSLKVVAVALTKICNDLRWMASGPRAGLGEIRLPELQKGSSIMPGKVNPVIPEAVLQVCAQVIGNDTDDHRRRDAGQLRAQRDDPGDGSESAAVDRPHGVEHTVARRAMRRRHRGRRGAVHGAGGAHPGDRDGAQSGHRLRRRDRDRRGGVGQRTSTARGRSRTGCVR